MTPPSAEAENFDLLVLAQEDGTVIYSSAEAPSAGIPESTFAKFSNLKPFFQQDQAEATFNEMTPKDIQSSTPLASIIREAKDAQMSIPRVSVTREAEISGTTYLLFLQPFQPPFPIVSQGYKDSANKQSLQSADDQQVWYIGGIIRKGEFQKKFLAVPLTVTGLAVLGLILGILSLPYIKLFFVNAGETLRAIDLCFLLVSLVLSSGLITLLLLNTVAYHNMRAQFDETVKNISVDIQDRFRKELDNTLKTFSVVPRIVTEGHFTGLKNLKLRHKEDNYFELPPKKGDFLKLLGDRYPFYESVFLVEEHGGLELEHWITFKPRKPTQSVNISGRKYFLRARDKQDLWTREGYPEFFIERVHSYTDGVKISIVSMPCEEIQQKEKTDSLDCVTEEISSHTNGKEDSAASENNKERETFAVAALAKRFLSFRALALPPKFGFAVIEDGSGKVIFHSDDQRSLIENFFWETDDNLALQAAVHARQECKAEQTSGCKIAGHYNGKKHHFFVTPIESVPWSLVVFYETRLLETVSFEIGVIAAGIFFLYVALFGLVIVLIHFFGPGEHWSWCWPQYKLQNQYAWVALPLVLTVLYYELGIWLLEGRLPLRLVVSPPLLVLGLLYLCLKLKRQDGVQRWKPGVAGLILLLGAMGGIVLWMVLSFEGHGGGSRTPGFLGWFFLTVMSLAYLLSLAYLTKTVLVPSERKRLFRSRTSKSYPRFWYLSVAFLSVFVISILPITAIFKGAFLAQSERFAKFRESEFASALKNREKTLHDDMYGLAERSEVSTVKKIMGSEDFSKEEIKPGLYEYEGDEVCLHKMNQNDSCKDNARDLNRIGHISEWFIDFLPVYNELAGKLRYPMSEQVGLSRLEYIENIRYQALPSLPVFCIRGSLSPWIVGLGIPIFLVVLFIVIRALAKRTVGLYLSDFGLLGKDGNVQEKASKEIAVHKLSLPYGPDERDTIKGLARTWIDTKTDTDKKRRIVVRPPRCLVSKLEDYADKNKFPIIDLSFPTQILLGQLRRWATAPPLTGVLVTNFESGILEPRLRLALLEALERVQAEIPVILCSSVSPLHHLVTPEAYPEFDEGIQDAVPKADEKFRWSALLSTFRKERFWYKAPDWRDEKGELQILSRECCWTDELIPIYEDLEDKIKYLTGEQIIHQVGDRAGAFYRKLWMLCTKEERLILIHLARGNMVNLKETDVLQRLLWRNLTRRDPDFRLPNESFANFVLTAEPPARIAEWEKGEADGSTWTMLRMPFVLLLVLVAVLIARTGGEGVQAMTAIISAVFAGLPILIQGLSFLRGGQTDKLSAE